ncbi:unnamed protein product [Pieris macdunnoughi]|uniref:Uncharacterized protein n=1 Tax=Pieris macdunnoughi TaxID=345717 RepID=A0A821NYX4_9NEOP|nr:unnamed protein product [Pieris macdunnoughi]
MARAAGRRRRGVRARRLLRSEHLRPRSVAPLAVCSVPAPAPGRAARSPSRRPRPRYVTLRWRVGVGRLRVPHCTAPLDACWRTRLSSSAGFVNLPGEL